MTYPTVPPLIASPVVGKAFLNSRTTAFPPALRSMTPNGPITGTAVTDTNASLFSPTTADWSLTPGT